MTISENGNVKQSKPEISSVSGRCRRTLMDELRRAWSWIAGALVTLGRKAYSVRPGGTFWSPGRADLRKVAIPGVLSLSVWLILVLLDHRLSEIGGFSIVDLELAQESETAGRILSLWQGSGTLIYARGIVILDYLFILLYSVFLYRVAKRAIGNSGGLIRYIPWLPPIVGMLDAIENIGLLTILFSSPLHASDPVIGGTTVVAISKFLLLGAFLLFLAWVLSNHYAAKIKTHIADARDVWKLVMLVRFSVLMLLVGVSFLFVGQWQEMLRAMTRWHAVALATASALAALSAWYTARVMYMFRFEGVPGSENGYECLKIRLPRVLGALMPVLVAVNVLKAGPQEDHVLLISMLGQVVSLLVFLAFVVYRRQIIGYAPEDYGFGRYRRMIDLVRGERDTALAMVALVVANVVMFVLFWERPSIAIFVGGSAVVLAAVATILPMGSFVVYLGNRFRFPSVAAVFALTILFSLFNDNHRVRLYPEMPSTLGGVLPAVSNENRSSPFGSLESYIIEWAAAEKRCHEGEPVPLFIVSTEGGGIRAAYWTAHVLGSLADNTAAGNRRFEDHLFALSGVSGGSLGSAAFVSQLADRPAGVEKDQPTDYVEGLHRFLGRDFLSPTIATLLFPDLMQRILPIALFNDRAITLEETWEAGWQESFADCALCVPRFEQPFLSLWSEGNMQIPLLFLNSTIVETGKRFIVHPLGYEGSKFGNDFSNAWDGHRLLGSEVPLSTAVHLSARFTYVSPAGTVANPDAGDGEAVDWYRLVDGGYFDNSGAVTAGELLKAIIRVRDGGKLKCPVSPFVVHISNDPVEEQKATGERTEWMSEVLSPLRTLLHVRPARGYQARDALRQDIRDDVRGSYTGRTGENQVRFVHFRLCESNVDLPLGWMLSESAKDEMHRQYGGPDGEKRKGEITTYNQENQRLVQLFLETAEASGEDPEVRETRIQGNCWKFSGQPVVQD